MEFILDNTKYSIKNHELYINYLMVHSYFKDHSNYDYNIEFDFLNALLKKDKIEFSDILEGTKVLEELIEKGEIDFLAYGVKIKQNINGDFNIYYQDLEFLNVSVGEAIPLLIALKSLVDVKPIITLAQIKEELDYFLEKFRSYTP